MCFCRAAYEMDLHTELLDMKVSSLCLDNQTQFSSPLGFYASQEQDQGQGQGQGLPPSLYAHTSSQLVDTNVAVNRYLSAPVALQSWRRELLS
jgi:hypothetical protein